MARQPNSLPSTAAASGPPKTARLPLISPHPKLPPSPWGGWYKDPKQAAQKALCLRSVKFTEKPSSEQVLSSHLRHACPPPMSNGHRGQHVQNCPHHLPRTPQAPNPEQCNHHPLRCNPPYLPCLLLPTPHTIARAITLIRNPIKPLPGFPPPLRVMAHPCLPSHILPLH